MKTAKTLIWKNWLKLSVTVLRLIKIPEFSQMEEYSQSHWDVWHACIQGWAPAASCETPACLCVLHCMSSVLMCPHVSPCVSQQEVPTPLNTKTQTKPAGCLDILSYSKILLMRACSMLWEPFLRPSLKAMRTLLTRPIQG